MKTLIIFLFAFASTTAVAADCRLYRYIAEVTQVYDGDSITVNVDLGFHTWIHGEKLRLYGINSPEVQSRGNLKVSDEEKVRGIIARDALREKILGKEVEICTIKYKTSNKDKKGKYGRYLAEIFFEGRNINEWLVENDYAEFKEY